MASSYSNRAKNSSRSSPIGTCAASISRTAGTGATLHSSGTLTFQCRRSMSSAASLTSSKTTSPASTPPTRDFAPLLPAARPCSRRACGTPRTAWMRRRRLSCSPSPKCAWGVSAHRRTTVVIACARTCARPTSAGTNFVSMMSRRCSLLKPRSGPTAWRPRRSAQTRGPAHRRLLPPR